MFYFPPATNALRVNPINGETAPITSPLDLAAFSTTEEAQAMLVAVRPLVPDVKLVDNPNGFTVQYGSDGRKINALVGSIDLQDGKGARAVADFVGMLIARKNWGGAWNEELPGPSEQLYVVPDGTFDTGDAVLVWGRAGLTPSDIARAVAQS